MSIRDLAETYLGRKISTIEWVNAREAAQQKLSRILSREGDANGQRLKPQYMAQLIAEAVIAASFSRITYEVMEFMAALEAKEKPVNKVTSNSMWNASIVTEKI